MKLVHCLDCGDIVRPLHAPATPRRCICRRHSVWWADDGRWRIAVHDAKGGRDRARLFRITNKFMAFADETTAESIREIVEAHPEAHHFRVQGSPIVKTRIGASDDAIWADAEPELLAGGGRETVVCRPGQRAGLLRRLARFFRST